MKNTLFLLALFGLLLFGISPSFAIAQTATPKNAVDAATQGTAAVLQQGTQAPAGASELTEENITEFLTKIASMAIRYVLVIAAIFIMLAGYIFIAAAGNKQKVEQAKQMLLYTIIGILVVLGAYLVVNLVLKQVSVNAVIP